MDTILRVAINKQANVVRHHFDLQDAGVTLPANLANDNLEPVIHTVHQHLAAVLWAPHDMEFAVEGDVVVAPHPRYGPDFVRCAYPPHA
jgi:hypothetical protein